MTENDRVCRRFYSQYAPRILCRPGEAAGGRVRELLPHLANGYNQATEFPSGSPGAAMNRLLVCLLLVGVTGCGKSDRTQKQPSGEGEQKAQQQTDGKPPSGKTEQATKQPPAGTEQAARADLGEFGGAYGIDEDGNVSEINLSGTQITDAALVDLKELKKLESLRLTGTTITDAGLVHLTGLTQLRYLNLSDTQVTNVGVVDLKKALSDCEILDAAGQRTEQPTKQPNNRRSSR